jgi:hypothetical protein
MCATHIEAWTQEPHEWTFTQFVKYWVSGTILEGAWPSRKPGVRYEILDLEFSDHPYGKKFSHPTIAVDSDFLEICRDTKEDWPTVGLGFFCSKEGCFRAVTSFEQSTLMLI